MGGTHEETAMVVSTVLFVSGVTTLLHITFGSRLPLIQGPSFVYLAPALAIINSPEFQGLNGNKFKHIMKELQGAIIIGSAFQALLGYTGLMSLLVRIIHSYNHLAMEVHHHHGKTEVAAARSNSNKSGFILRVLALILTVAATIVTATNKQTKIIPLKVFDSLPPVNLPVSAKWHYQSAILYFLVTNAISCAYAAVSLLLTAANRGGKSKNLRILIFVLDAFMLALLFSGVGAASAVGVLGYRGNSHVRWNKVCNVFGKFCHQMLASIGLSLVGSLAFLFLVMLPLISSA